MVNQVQFDQNKKWQSYFEEELGLVSPRIGQDWALQWICRCSEELVVQYGRFASDEQLQIFFKGLVKYYQDAHAEGCGLPAEALEKSRCPDCSCLKPEMVLNLADEIKAEKKNIGFKTTTTLIPTALFRANFL